MTGLGVRAPAGKMSRTAIAIVVAAAGFAGVRPAAASEDDARAILKAMSDYVGGEKNISLTFDSDIEVITPQLEKIQFTNSGDILLSRPDKLRAHRVGGYADVEMVFDGQTVSVLGKSLNGYAQAEAKGTVDQLVASLRVGQGIALPGADLILSNAFDALIADVLEAKHIGRGVVGEVECEHLAFRNFDTDWQLWVEVGAKPIPRKLVITSKTLASGPQYTLQINDWKTGAEPAADAFAFAAPAGATQLKPEDFMKLDELPDQAPTGGKAQ